MSDIGVDYMRIMREEARLIILKEVARQENETLMSSVLEEVLPVFAIRQPRAWIHQQMDYLATMGALVVKSAGTVKIGTLTDLGRRHIDRDSFIEGVKRPARPGS